MAYKPHLSSIGAALLLMIASLPLGGGCNDNNESAVKIYAANEDGIAECKHDHPARAAECESALQTAEKEQEKTVRRYSYNECVGQFGTNACVARDNGSFWIPAITGFMVGQVVNNMLQSHPVYVDRQGYAYNNNSYIGNYRPGAHIYVAPPPNATWTKSYRTTSIPRDTPWTPPVYTPSGKIERGGAGAAASITRSTPPQQANPNTVAPRIERGGAGSTAAVSKAAPPTNAFRPESSTRSVSPPSTSWHSEAASRSFSSPSISRGGAGSTSSGSVSSG